MSSSKKPKQKTINKRKKRSTRRRIPANESSVPTKKVVKKKKDTPRQQPKRKPKKLPRKKIKTKDGLYTLSQNPVSKHYVDREPPKKQKAVKKTPKKQKKGCVFYLVFMCFILLAIITFLLVGIYNFTKNTYEEIQERDTEEVIEYFEEKLNSEAGQALQNFLEDNNILDTSTLEDQAKQDIESQIPVSDEFPVFTTPENN